MKNVYDVLRLKETDVSRLQIEVDALRRVAPLLAEDGDFGNDDALVAIHSTPWPQPGQVPEAVNSNPQPDHSPEWRSRGLARS